MIRLGDNHLAVHMEQIQDVLELRFESRTNFGALRPLLNRCRLRVLTKFFSPAGWQFTLAGDGFGRERVRHPYRMTRMPQDVINSSGRRPSQRTWLGVIQQPKSTFAHLV